VASLGVLLGLSTWTRPIWRPGMATPRALMD